MTEAIACMKGRSFLALRDSRLPSRSMHPEQNTMPRSWWVARAAALIQPGDEPMPQAGPVSPEDPFPGLLLPVEAWKAIDAAHITSLEQLKALAPTISQIPRMDPDLARIIQDRLDRLAARRAVRVRLIFPKRAHHNRPSTRAKTRPVRTR